MLIDLFVIKDSSDFQNDKDYIILDTIEEIQEKLFHPEDNNLYGFVTQETDMIQKLKQYTRFIFVRNGMHIKNAQDIDANYIAITIDNEIVYLNIHHHPEMQYLRLLNEVYNHGKIHSKDRTGVGTRCLFGKHLEIDLRYDYFPVQDTRRTPMKTIWREIQWYLSGSTDVNELRSYNIHVWDGNTSRDFLDKQGLHHYPEYDMGPTYGFQFRHAGAEYSTCKSNYDGKGVDQWKALMDGLIESPQGRRHIIQLYNVQQLHEMALPPCLMMYQFFIDDKNENELWIDVHAYSRSSDFFLAGYWNLCQIRILLECVIQEIQPKLCKKIYPRKLLWSIGNIHIYENQLNSVKELLNYIPTTYYRLKCIDPLCGPQLCSEYKPQSKLTSRMAV